MLCEYGCQLEALYTLRNGKMCCSKTYQSCSANKLKNSNGLKSAYARGVKFNVYNDLDRKKSHESRRINLQNKPFEFWGKKLKRDFILTEQDNCCLICKNSMWMGKLLLLQLDHIDGNSANNKRDNLRLLCPNCHSQTDTYCGKNINNGKIKISDTIIIETYLKIKDVYKTMIAVGLGRRGNYKRVYKLIEKFISTSGEIGETPLT